MRAAAIRLRPTHGHERARLRVGDQTFRIEAAPACPRERAACRLGAKDHDTMLDATQGDGNVISESETGTTDFETREGARRLKSFQ